MNTESGKYLACLFSIPFVGAMLSYFGWSLNLEVGVYLPFVKITLGALFLYGLYLAFQGDTYLRGDLYICYLVVLMSLAILRTWYENTIGLPVIVYLCCIILMMVKRPSSRDVRNASSILISLIITSVILVAIMDSISGKISTIEPARSGIAFVDAISTNRRSYIFSYSNLAGYILGMMAILALKSIRNLDVAFFWALMLACLLTGSRGAIISTSVSGMLFLGFSQLRLRQMSYIAIISIAVLVYIVSAILMNIPNSESSALGNRLGIWIEYLKIFSDNGGNSIGTSGIVTNQSLGLIQPAASNAHNLLVDGLVRFGFAFFALELASVFVLLLIGYKYLAVLIKQGGSQMEGFRIGGVFLVFSTSCMLESLISWNTLTPMKVAQLQLFLYFWTVGNEHSVSTR
jgi:hypothetical protein